MTISLGAYLLSSCGGKETAVSLGKEYCKLMEKAQKATGDAKFEALSAVSKFQQDVKEKYKDNKAFVEEVRLESEKCMNGAGK
jgi:hypothetical protein